MKVLANIGKKTYKMKVDPAADGVYRITIDDEEHTVDARRVGGGGIFSLLVGNQSFETHVAGSKGNYHVALVGSALEVTLQDELASRVAAEGSAARAGVQSIEAPMPGLIVDMKVKEGDQVEAGQAVAIVEAMKMQNELTAPGPGTVSEVHVKKGDAVASGQPLVTITSE
jgi:biotin carboxyl carrier protein